MPEAVVVALEAVQVQDHQEDRPPRWIVEHCLQVGHEPPAVAETGEHVRDRLLAGEREESPVLAERDREPQEDEQEAAGGEAHRQHVDAREVVDDEDADGDDRARDGNRQERATVDLELSLFARVDPGRERDQQRRGRPQGVDEAPLLVGVDLEQVDAVCDRRREDAETEDQPATVELPAGEREDAEDGRQQQDVAERVGEVRRDRAARALEGPEDDLDEHGRAERRRGHGRREPVEPERSGERPCPALHQQHDRDVRQRIERDPAEVGERGEAGRLGGEGVELAERVAGERRRHHRPRKSIVAHEHRPRPGDERGGDDQRVVEPDLQGRDATAGGVPEHDEEEKEAEGAEGEPQRRGDPGTPQNHVTADIGRSSGALERRLWSRRARRATMAPGGVEPPHAGSKPAALSAELRGRVPGG